MVFNKSTIKSHVDLIINHSTESVFFYKTWFFKICLNKKEPHSNFNISNADKYDFCYFFDNRSVLINKAQVNPISASEVSNAKIEQYRTVYELNSSVSDIVSSAVDLQIHIMKN